VQHVYVVISKGVSVGLSSSHDGGKTQGRRRVAKLVDLGENMDERRASGL
jgi:hypothetical protein